MIQSTMLLLLLTLCLSLRLSSATPLDDASLSSHAGTTTTILHKTDWGTWYLTESPPTDTDLYPQGVHIFITRPENCQKKPKTGSDNITGETTILYAVHKTQESEKTTRVLARYHHIDKGLCFSLTKEKSDDIFPRLIACCMCTYLQDPPKPLSVISGDLDTIFFTYALPRNPDIPEDALFLRITSTKAKPFKVTLGTETNL